MAHPWKQFLRFPSRLWTIREAAKFQILRISSPSFPKRRKAVSPIPWRWRWRCRWISRKKQRNTTLIQSEAWVLTKAQSLNKLSIASRISKLARSCNLLPSASTWGKCCKRCQRRGFQNQSPYTTTKWRTTSTSTVGTNSLAWTSWKPIPFQNYKSWAMDSFRKSRSYRSQTRNWKHSNWEIQRVTVWIDWGSRVWKMRI